MKTVDLTNEEVELILALLRERYDEAQRFVKSANPDTAPNACSVARQDIVLCAQLIGSLQ